MSSLYYTKLIQRNPYLDKLVGYFPFNANAGDASGKGNDGTVVNVGSLSFSAGKVGNAIDFSNTTAINYVAWNDLANFSFTDGTNDVAFSISIWVKVTSFSTGGNWLFNKRGSATNMEYQLDIANGQLFFYKWSGGGTANYQEIKSTATNAIPTGSWQNIIYTNKATNDINDGKFYLNGSLLTVTRTTVGTYAGMIDTTAISRLGNGAWALSESIKHRGLVDEFYIWKGRELTASEASDIYAKGNSGVSLLT